MGCNPGWGCFGSGAFKPFAFGGWHIFLVGRHDCESYGLGSWLVGGRVLEG